MVDCAACVDFPVCFAWSPPTDCGSLSNTSDAPRGKFDEAEESRDWIQFSIILPVPEIYCTVQEVHL